MPQSSNTNTFRYLHNHTLRKVNKKNRKASQKKIDNILEDLSDIETELFRNQLSKLPKNEKIKENNKLFTKKVAKLVSLRNEREKFNRLQKPLKTIGGNKTKRNKSKTRKNKVTKLTFLHFINNLV